MSIRLIFGPLVRMRPTSASASVRAGTLPIWAATPPVTASTFLARARG